MIVVPAVARRPRLHVSGAFYHVTLRGNHRQAIFRNEADRALLDEIVAETIGILGARIHAFCWMTNHIHALVQVADAPLGQIVMRIASKYARRFQVSLETTGHLFERRYHSVLVDVDNYLLTLVRYIHLNPVRAGLVGDPADYPWSSHRDYLGAMRHEWVHTSFALSALSPNPQKARAAYSSLMKGREETRWGCGNLTTNPHNAQVLGSDAFLKNLGDVLLTEGSRTTLDDLILECASRFKLAAEDLAGGSRSRDKAVARAWLAHEALHRGIATASAVARRLQRSEAALRGLMSRHPRHPVK